MPGKKKGRDANKWTLVKHSEIEEYQKKHGLTDTALAKKLSVSLGSIGNWKRGGAAQSGIQARIRGILDGKPGTSQETKSAAKNGAAAPGTKRSKPVGAGRKPDEGLALLDDFGAKVVLMASENPASLPKTRAALARAATKLLEAHA